MSADGGELCGGCGRLLDRVLIAERAIRHPACEQPAGEIRTRGRNRDGITISRPGPACEQPATPAGNADHLAALRALAAAFPTARLITDERTA